MSITGHRTEAVYNRYNIADLAYIAKATAKLEEEQKAVGDSQVASYEIQAEQPFRVEIELSQQDSWWAHQDLNLGQTDYECVPACESKQLPPANSMKNKAKAKAGQKHPAK